MTHGLIAMCSFSGCFFFRLLGKNTFWILSTWDFDGFDGYFSGHFLGWAPFGRAVRVRISEALPGSAHDTSCTAGVFPTALGKAGLTMAGQPGKRNENDWP